MGRQGVHPFSMASPNTIFGTDMPKLADELALLLRQPHGEPFKRDLIILDGKASAHWLSHYLVRSAKISENPQVVGLGIHMNAKLVNTQLFHQEIARLHIKISWGALGLMVTKPTRFLVAKQMV